VISLRDVPGIPISIVRSLNQYFSQYCPYKPMVTVGVNNGEKDFKKHDIECFSSFSDH
jgi:hypothetical protein